MKIVFLIYYIIFIFYLSNTLDDCTLVIYIV